jgi:hypothetical protein
MSTPTNRLLVTGAAAAAVSGGLFAQPDAAADPQTQLIQQMAEIRAEGGPSPSGLIEPLRALAVLYQETDDHALAIVALEEARYVTRVHQGLSSADEALLLRQQLRSEKALGDHQRVWDIEQAMVTVARQHHDDIRMMPIFREMADDRADALEEYGSGGFPPEIELGCYYVPGLRRYDDTSGEHRPPPSPGGNQVRGDCFSGQSMYVNRRLRAEILMFYADAIEVIVQSGDYASQELRDLEKQAVLMFPTAFDTMTWPVGNPAASSGAPPFAPLFLCSSEALNELLALEILGSCLEPVVHADGLVTANVGGLPSLVRLIAYEIRSGAPAAVRGKAFAELADWYLLSSPADHLESSERALEIYERAYRELQQDGVARASMFSPEVPVTFGPNLFRSPAKGESPRHIDVSFDITKYGRGKRIEILDTSKGATRPEVRDLIRLIEGTRFRPRFVDGKLADSTPVVVRYHLD